MPPAEAGYTGETASDAATDTTGGLLANRTRWGPLTWWLRIVGAFYLLLFVMVVFVKLPLAAFGPEGILQQAAAGDAVARFTVDTWVMFGLELGAIGVALVVASRYVERAAPLVWTVMAIELTRGIIDDIYMIAVGYEPAGYVVWIVIHSVIIAAGYLALRRAGATPGWLP